MNRAHVRIVGALLVGLTIVLICHGAASVAFAGEKNTSTTVQQATYTLGRCVMASGGTFGALSSNYFHHGTVGQAIIGGTQSANNFLIAGFWQLPSLATGVAPGERPDVPATFVLYQNYPNPFNPTTTIRYGLPQKSSVALLIFNTFGQQVAQFANSEMEAGYHEFQFHGQGLASGVYFFRLQVRPVDSAAGRDSKSGAGSFMETKKLLLLK